MTGFYARCAVAPAVLVLFLGIALAQTPGPILSVSDLIRNPAQYSDQNVTVRGTLQMTGTNYHADPGFVLVDSQGNRVAVSPWVPLEVPPRMPGSTVEGTPVTMRDFLGHTVVLTGVIRVNRANSTLMLAARTGMVESGSQRTSAVAAASRSTSPPVPAPSAPSVRGSSAPAPASQPGRPQPTSIAPASPAPQAAPAPLRPKVAGPTVAPRRVPTAPAAPAQTPSAPTVKPKDGPPE